MKPQLKTCYKCGKRHDIADMRLEVTFSPCCYLCVACHERIHAMIRQWLTRPQQLELELDYGRTA